MLVHNTCGKVTAKKAKTSKTSSGAGKGRVNNYTRNISQKNNTEIKAEDLSMSETVLNHANDIIKKGPNKGMISRPYIESNGTTLLVDEIMNAKSPVKDLYLKNGLRWDVPGSFRGSRGGWELVVDLDNKKIVHFNFTVR